MKLGRVRRDSAYGSDKNRDDVENDVENDVDQLRAR